MNRILTRHDRSYIEGLMKKPHVPTYMCGRCGVERPKKRRGSSKLCHQCQAAEKRYDIVVPLSEFYRIADELGRAS